MINLGEHCEIFSCPICKGAMELRGRALSCENRHSFDLAKSGYINFLTRPVKSDYTKALWDSRRQVMVGEMFHPLTLEIGKLLDNHLKKEGYILDAGCGEGSHLDRLLVKRDGFTGVGIDLSKDGVQMAAKDYPQHVWTVGDLTATPFKDGSFNAIVNILSPANYWEFKRLLANKGVVIKVMPEANYLKELRKTFQTKESYSNKGVAELFASNFTSLNQVHVSYEFAPPSHLIKDIITMTPLSWNVPPHKAKEALTAEIESITMDFLILVGQ